MYNIGICDDGKNTCAFLEEMILEYAEKRGIKIDIEVWYSGETLCKYLEQKGHLDILFLDIELFELTGIEVGEFIRNRIGDRGMQIIYISGKSSYAQQLFKTQPMDFLVKPINRRQIEESLELALQILEKNSDKFEFQKGKDYFYITYGEIIYFESVGRKIKIVDTSVSEKEFYGGIKKLEKTLPKEFFPIHQSFIINKIHVVRYTYEMVEMDNCKILPISKAYRKQVRERLLRG
ncbi:MAG: LytR/AlgR family response regulator transcription factor [Lachnospiraceae bacterium]